MITLQRLCADSGTGEKQARRMVRNRQLPGIVDRYGAYVCTDGEYQRWLDGTWSPTGALSEPAYRAPSKSAPANVTRLVRKVGSAA